VKRSGRDEPMWVAIHKCIEAMLGISLYSYLYLKLPKTLCLSYYLLCFFFNKIREHEGGAGSARKWRRKRVCGGGGRRGEVAQILYTHISISKCKNDNNNRKIGFYI
jgi:hypothetical protein